MSDLVNRDGFPWLIWTSSVIFSVVVLAGYRSLEQLAFLGVVGVLALIHVLAVITRPARLSMHLFLSQSLVVAATLVGIFLHVSHVVGQIPPRLPETLGSFLQATLLTPSTYLQFVAYGMVLGIVLGLLLLGLRAFSETVEVTPELALASAYTMSSVNIAFDYSLNRPLYHVSGDLDATAFFFSAGLFGVEFSLPLHLLLLVLCLMWHQMADRRAHLRHQDQGGFDAPPE